MTHTYSKRQLQIIHTAVELIAARGMSYLTMKHIAEKISVTEPALYRHFNSKREILLGVIALIHHNGQMPEITEKKGFDLIEYILNSRIRSFTGMPELAAIIFSEEMFSGDNELSRQIKTLMQETQKKMTMVIRQAQQESTIRQDIEAEQIALLVIGSFRFLVNQWHLFNNSFDLESRAAMLFQDFRKLLLS